MNDERRKWIDLFEREGWVRFGQIVPSPDLDLVAVAYRGAPEGRPLALKDVVEANDEFLVFEYDYETVSASTSEGASAEKGRARIWVPWPCIDYVFRTRLNSGD